MFVVVINIVVAVLIFVTVHKGHVVVHILIIKNSISCWYPKRQVAHNTSVFD